MAQMAETPEMLANNLAFLQIDLTDPEFRQWTLTHFSANDAGYRALLEDAGFRDVELYHRHGYSWSVLGTKP